MLPPLGGNFRKDNVPYRKVALSIYLIFYQTQSTRNVYKKNTYAYNVV